MNITQNIAKRERGLRFSQDYDIALSRLICYNSDVYKGIESNSQLLNQFNPDPPVFVCRFSSTPGHQEILALANEDGKIALQDTTKKYEPNTPLPGTQAHEDAIFDIAWMPQEMKLITVSGDHSARLWDLSLSDPAWLETFKAHTRSVKSVVFRPQDKDFFVTGARDGAIAMWDIRANHTHECRKPDNYILNAHVLNSATATGGKSKSSRRLSTTDFQARSITGLVFQNENTLISCSDGDGFIKVWDLRKNYSTHKKDPVPKHTITYKGGSSKSGFSSLLICSSGITLYASCMDNIIYSYNTASYSCEPIAAYYGHNNLTFFVKACLSPDGKYLISGSSNEKAYIWAVKKPGKPLLQLSGSREEVTCVEWCNTYKTKIVTCSDDARHRIWHIGKEIVSNDEKIYVCGSAEIISECFDPKSNIRSVEKTPKLSRPQSIEESLSHLNTTPDSNENSHSAGSIRKSYLQIYNNYWSESVKKSVLSPIEENFESPTKRPCLDNRGARRLFSPDSKTEMQSKVTCKYDEAGPSSSRQLAVSHYSSPTSNLPNFVVDGTAPHLLQMSPLKSKENIDWLTKIRKERYSQGNSKSAEKASSPKNQNTPVRKRTRSKSTEPQKTPISAKSLLHFLKPAAKDSSNNLYLESTNVESSSSDRI